MDYYEDICKSTLIDKIEVNSYGLFSWTPNDDDYNQQWHMDVIGMASAWNITKGDNSSVVIAILDSGCEWWHEDLGIGSDNYRNILVNSGEDAWTDPTDPSTGNNVDDDNNGFVDDWMGWNFNGNDNDVSDNYYSYDIQQNPPQVYTGHGTSVAGVASAKSNNSTGVAGISGGNNGQGVKLLIVKIGETYNNGPSTADVVNGIEYAKDRGAKIINMSFGISYSAQIDAAIEDAYSNGILLIAAAGNGNEDVDYPASHALVMAIGSTVQDDARHAFNSNTGMNLDMVAPGKDIYTTKVNNSYDEVSGTSFATPMVCGVAALMLTTNSCLSNANAIDILTMTADKVRTDLYDYHAFANEKDNFYDEVGYGRLNAYKAVNTANLMKVTGPDLYMKDQPWDFGIEPNPDPNGICCLSEDIWVRNQSDGFTNQKHQTPLYIQNTPVYVYVRVRNKGCQANGGTNEKLKVYWSKASTALNWPTQWVNFYYNSVLHGDIIPSSPVTIASIQPGEEDIYEFIWYPPNPADFSVWGGDAAHFCLLARIETTASSPYGMTVTETLNLPDNVLKNNNIIWKNITIVPWPGKKGRVFIGNPTNATALSKLRFKVKSGDFDGDIKIDLGASLLAKWRTGGSVGQNVQVSNDSMLVISSEEAYISNFSLASGEFIVIECDFSDIDTETPLFKFEVSQDIWTGSAYQYIGAEYFTLDMTESNSPAMPTFNDKLIRKTEQDMYSIYPNPTSGFFFIRCPSRMLWMDKKVVIRNFVGEIIPVPISVNSEGVAIISLQNYCAGIYFLEIIDEIKGEKAIYKLIKM